MATCPECRQQFPDSVLRCPEHGVALVPDALFAHVDQDLPPGALVSDYAIESLLGEGSFGKVYRAVHPVIGRRAAVKVLSRALSADPQSVSRFIAEARAIVELRSPHIVDVYGFGALDDGRQYYLMELLDGDTLEAHLRERGKLGGSEAMRILTGIADALSVAHAAGIVHRDLKPENVFVAIDVAGQPVPKLLDFGVAKLLGKQQLAFRTSTGAMVGTPTYMAPEQALGLEVDHRADIYAFGIVAFELLAGRPPFEAPSLIELVRLHTSEPPPLLSTLRAELGAAFDAPLVHLLAKDPADRPATIADGLEELRAAATSAGIDVPARSLVSLRPPAPGSARPSSPRPTWDADTVKQSARKPSEAASAGGSAGQTLGAIAGSSGRASELPPKRGRAVRMLIGLGAVGAVVAGLVVLVRAPDERAAPAAPVVSESTTAALPSGAPAARGGVTTSDPSGASVTLRVDTDVADAVVLFQGQELGRAPGPLPLARGSTMVQVELRAPGYEPVTHELVPDRDHVWRPQLVRRSSRRPVTVEPKPAETSTFSLSPVLAEPYADGGG